MALVSPGISISINDQSQYVNANVGSVPLVLLATAQDKTYNGSPASGTSKANAGTLLSFSSQRDLITQMGTPTFQIGASGTPVNGSEINEYGLLAAYSALGLSNQVYAIRADVDLAQLTGTSVRPVDAPADGTYWLDTVNTNWGLSYSNSSLAEFVNIAPHVITDPTQVANDNTYSYNVPTPISSFGNVGDYALVMINTDGTTPTTIRLFYKAGTNSYKTGSNNYNLNNIWVEVGSTPWQQSVPVAVGTVLNPTIATSSTLTINGVVVTSDASVTTLSGASGLVAKINTANSGSNIPGVYASISPSGALQLFVTSAAKSTGLSGAVDGKLVLVDGTHNPLYTAGIVTSYPSATLKGYCPILFYGNYAQEPVTADSLQLGWFPYGTNPGLPTGSVWWKTTATGGGFSPVIKQYSASTGTFTALTAPMYYGRGSAVYGMDPTGGGANIVNGELFASFFVYDTTSNNLTFFAHNNTNITTATGGTPAATFTGSSQFLLGSTAPGSSAFGDTTITLPSTGSGAGNAVIAKDIVTAILAANIPYITSSLTSTGNITITHTSGGEITLVEITSGIVTAMGFGASSGGTGYSFIPAASNSTGANEAVISGFTNITNVTEYQVNQPYSSPATGTYWYYSNPSDVDIMINTGSGWAGYLNGGIDVRGFNLASTSVSGVIISPVAPTSEPSGASLAAGDLWLNSSDLINYPNLSRWNGTAWVAIDNTDHVSSAGIIFADARWDTTGTTDVISGTLPTITSLLTSNYIDLDAPDYRLYPRGMLLWNTRRSGYNVKKFVSNYFNSTSFPPANVSNNPANYPTATPVVTNAWVTASGLNNNGTMNAGSAAQRAIVTAAMKSAIDSNLDVLSPNFQFNLMCAPGYPELISNMITLNDNRGDTAFIIGDTPMDLAPNTVDITDWVNNTSGIGLESDASTNAYLALYYPAGQTNDLAGNTVVVPASHAVLRTFLYNDQVSYPWFAPAGVNRGVISNLSDIGYVDSTSGYFVHNGISQGLRDALFTLNINPITQLPGSGLVVFGQLTRSGTTTARDRVNVVRLENYLRTIFNSIANGYLFEPNDAVTRKTIASQIEGALNNILAHRGLYDYLVICDTSNNTAATIANNQLYVDVAIEPMRDVEFIYIPIAIYNPGSIAKLNATST